MHDHVPPSIPSVSCSISGGQPSIATRSGLLRFPTLSSFLAAILALSWVGQAGAVDSVTLGNGD